MPAPAEAAVRVEGLQQLRRDLRKLGPDATREVRDVIRHAAELVAAEARPLAPHRTGRLAASIRPTTSGDRGVIRSPLPYAGVQHWGGVIRPRGAPIRIRRTEFITKALDRQRARVIDALGDGIEDAARRNGWH